MYWAGNAVFSLSSFTAASRKKQMLCSTQRRLSRLMVCPFSCLEFERGLGKRRRRQHHPRLWPWIFSSLLVHDFASLFPMPQFAECKRGSQKMANWTAKGEGGIRTGNADNCKWWCVHHYAARSFLFCTTRLRLQFSDLKAETARSDV